MKIELLETGDGSHTLFLPDMDETYHSRKGAQTESEYVYLKQGLDYLQLDSLRILEFGFGTGMNAWLTLKRSLSNPIEIDYTSIELFPLEESVWQNLNHAGSQADELWMQLMESPWETTNFLTERFKLKKLKNSWMKADAGPEPFDLIYYDAFAPSKQPEVWDTEHLTRAFDLLKPGGILVTYCAQGQFKRNLKQVGFEVERLPGPPGKAEMTRATKPLSK